MLSVPEWEALEDEHFAYTAPAETRARVNFTTPVRPESLGLSSERLERVAELLQRQIEERTFSGAVTLIARDDRIVYFRAKGLMDIDSKRAMQNDAVFRIMSMTKPVVALSILMMVEEGKVRVTDPVSTFIPELQRLAVAISGEPGCGSTPRRGAWSARPAGRRSMRISRRSERADDG